MIIQYIKFETSLTEAEVMATAESRAEQFRAIPGLIQKYYVKCAEPNTYGGVYVWDSQASLATYRASDLASSIASAYKVIGAPQIEVMDTLFPLRE